MKMQRMLPFVQVRAFGGKPAAGGPPSSGAPFVDTRPHTALEELVEHHGIENFLFGPPPGVTKRHNAHRDYAIPKLSNTMEFFAKRMRD